MINMLALIGMILLVCTMYLFIKSEKEGNEIKSTLRMLYVFFVIDLLWIITFILFLI